MSDSFLILGASGLVGAKVVERLRREGREVLAASRRPNGPGGVRLDLLDPSTFAAALRGVSTVMLISRPKDDDAHLYAAPFVQAMQDAGVRRVVVLSALGAQKRPDFSLRKVELLVEASGIRWVHVRPNFFMEMIALPPLSTEIASRGTLSLPVGDAKVAYVAADDVAAVLHRALVDDRLDGTAWDVSGPYALGHDALVEGITARTGRPVRYVSLGDDEARNLMLTRGLTPRQVERVLAFYQLIRQGFCSAPDAAVSDLLGRPLRSWEEIVEQNKAVWSAPVAESARALV